MCLGGHTGRSSLHLGLRKPREEVKLSLYTPRAGTFKVGALGTEKHRARCSLPEAGISKGEGPLCQEN